MDFFASQQEARQSSRNLLLLFVLALLSIVLLANLAVYLVIKFQSLGVYQFDWELAGQITVAVLLLVVAGSIYRIHSLKRGGEAVAAALGGQLVAHGGKDEYEQRLVNVVEEMAIASGLPVPPIYLLEEDGINAFAAGYSSNDAVIGVTRGAIMALSRDELQGVVAHEFSHIMHGDMTLNIRLVGLLHGILMLSHAGRLMLEARPGVARRSSGAFPVLFFGMSLFFIGYLGKFFGDLIKAGVSRQREFLADASAVQYTRNNAGIAGALKRIGGHAARSNVSRAGSDEFSHLYFSNASQRSITALFATHPPLDDRILRLEPGWSGEYLHSARLSDPKEASSDLGARQDSDAQVQGFAAQSNIVATKEAALDSSEVVESVSNAVGQVGSVAVAAQLIGGIPSVLRSAAREPFSVRAIVYCLLLHKSSDKQDRQLDGLKNRADVFVKARMREVLPEVDKLEAVHKLPLIELSLPALKQLSDGERRRFLENVSGLLKAATPIGLSQWALSYYLFHHMTENYRSMTGSKSLSQLKRPIEYLLSMLAHSDHHVHGDAPKAFASGCTRVGLDLDLVPKSELSIARLESSMERLNHLRPLLKPKVLKAFVATIAADSHLSAVEIELVRCFADAIDCPLPPLFVH